MRVVLVIAALNVVLGVFDESIILFGQLADQNLIVFFTEPLLALPDNFLAYVLSLAVA